MCPHCKKLIKPPNVQAIKKEIQDFALDSAGFDSLKQRYIPKNGTCMVHFCKSSTYIYRLNKLYEINF